MSLIFHSNKRTTIFESQSIGFTITAQPKLPMKIDYLLISQRVLETFFS